MLFDPDHGKGSLWILWNHYYPSAADPLCQFDTKKYLRIFCTLVNTHEIWSKDGFQQLA